MVLLGVLAAAFASPWELPDRGRPLDDRSPPSSPAADDEIPTAAPTPTAEDGEPWSGRILIALLALTILIAMIVLLVLAVRRILEEARGIEDRRRLRELEKIQHTQPGTAEAALGTEPDVPALRRAVRVAESVLDRAGEPGDAVIAAWLELEAAAAGSGVPREPSQTPTEFTAAVLRATTADGRAIETLLRLYHRARFGTGEVTRLDAADVDVVRTCLRRLAESWGTR